MTRCANCPVANDATCLGTTAKFSYMCQYAVSDDPVHRRHVIERSAIGLSPTPQPPPMLERAASFVGAVASHIAAGAPTASVETQETRLAICRTNQCGRYRDDGGPACLACGCGAKGLALKASWAEQSCPLDPPMWGPVAPMESPAARG